MAVSVAHFDLHNRVFSNRREARRRRILQLIFVVYFCLIFENALRKWGLPEFKNALFFIRVPFTLAIYWLAWYHRQWPKTSWPQQVAYGFAVVAIMLIPIQMVVGEYDVRHLLIAGYGWVNYFFYVPLAFIIADQFQKEDMQRLARMTLWTALVVMPIVMLQFALPNVAFINQGWGEDSESIGWFTLPSSPGFFRPTGVFSSSLGLSTFAASAAMFVLHGWLARVTERLVSRGLLIAGTAAVMVITMMSQSRTLFFYEAIILVAAVVAGAISGRKRLVERAIVLPLVLVGLVAIFWPILFPESFEAFSDRWTGAYDYELTQFKYGVFGKALFPFYGFLEYIGETPLIGYLLGLAGNAAAQLSWVKIPEGGATVSYGGWAEDPWAKHVVELGPLIGVTFIVFRIAMTVWLGRLAARNTRGDSLLPMLIFGFVGIILLLGQITGNGTINGYNWMFLGFCLAAMRIRRKSSS